MKVLYIGCYREGTGWGNSAIDYILALDSVGIDVVCRPVKLNNDNPDLPERILELEAKDSSGCDVCIQHVLPHHMEYNSSFKKNIGLYFTETSSFEYSPWPNRINQLDEGWVSCQQSLDASIYSGVKIPLKIIPLPTDVSRFERTYQPLEIPEIKDTFTFYFIGEAIRRKNLVALIKAFHLEFSPNELVSLVIKTNKSNMSSEECHKHVSEICSQIKNNLKLYKSIDDYKNEVIITQRLSDEQMMGLHTSCDCFVMPSFGEAWCIPAFNAMGFGKTPICTNVGGMSEFLKNGGGFLVEGNSEPVFGMTETFHDIYTAREDWCNIDIRYLQSEMRYVHDSHVQKDSEYFEVKKQGIKSAYDYSYKAVGTLMQRGIEDAL
jgi:glycosyltransferase involved in cell wall biosynthesis